MYMYSMCVETCVAHVAQREKGAPDALPPPSRTAGTIPLPSSVLSGGVSVAGHLCCRAPLFIDPSFNNTRSNFFNFKSLFLDPVSWLLDLPLEAPREPHWSVSQFVSHTHSFLVTYLFTAEIFFFLSFFPSHLVNNILTTLAYRIVSTRWVYSVAVSPTML